MREFDLQLVFPALREQANEYIAERDAGGLITTLSDGDRMAFVFDNFRQLKECGMYEASLLVAFTYTKTNHSHWDDRVIELMFSDCDRAKLLAAGDPLPDGDTFTLYRGVAGVGKRRRLRGFSWTDDLGCACWFATQERLALPNPAIMAATVNRAEILAFYNGRNEREFIVRPANATRLKLTGEEMKELGRKWREKVRQDAP